MLFNLIGSSPQPLITRRDTMSYRTERAIAFAPGVALRELEEHNPDMILDPDEGDLVPVDQVIRDPLRLQPQDPLPKSSRGSSRNPTIANYDGADSEGLGDDSDETTTSPSANAQEELGALVAAQELDMMTRSRRRK